MLITVGGAVGIRCLKARDAKCPIIHRTVPNNEELTLPQMTTIFLGRNTGIVQRLHFTDEDKLRSQVRNDLLKTTQWHNRA